MKVLKCSFDGTYNIALVDGKKKLQCIKMELGEPDRSGVVVRALEQQFWNRGRYYWCNWSEHQYTIPQRPPCKLNKWGDIEINGKTPTSEANISWWWLCNWSQQSFRL